MPPNGIDVPPSIVLYLKKALYSIKLALYYWFETISLMMQKLGFTPINSDICLFRYVRDRVLVLLYIDDLLIAAKKYNAIAIVAAKLKKVYALKEIGEVKRFLGFNVIRDYKARKIFIS
jgi:hypothetical protein